MAISGLMIRNEAGTSMQISIVHFLTFMLMGCAHAETPGEYRESNGKVVKFVVKQSDPIHRITWFLKLKDGSVIRPEIYYYQTQFTLLGIQRVEESARTSQTTSTNKKKFIYLPYSEEIDTYLLLVRTPVPKEVEKDGKTETVYEQSALLLLEIPAKDVSPEKPLVFPSYEELSSRELPKEQQKLLKDLVKRYDLIKAAAKKRRDTPMPIPGLPADSYDKKEEEKK